MDILELIDLEHPNNQQEMRPFPCSWESCTKVCDERTRADARLSADDQISHDTNVSIRMNDLFPVRMMDATSLSSSEARLPCICACIPASALISASGSAVENPLAMYVSH